MFRRFMYGRYGVDHLNNAIMIVALAFGISTWFVSGIADAVLSLIQMLLLALWFMRAFSRNIYKRREENNRFLLLWGKLKQRFKGVSAFFSRLADRKHKYFKCEKCKSRLRVPRGRGNITVTCPRCKHKFDKKV